MDFGNMLGDSFAYAKDAVVGKWKQWLLLIIATVLLTIPLMGYTLKVFRGEKPAPEVTGWGTLIIDGIKYIIVAFVWAIPCLIILLLTLGSLIAAIASGNSGAAMGFIGGALIGLLIFLVVAIITSLLATIGIVRFARTGSMGEAFNFGAILATIGKIGWGTYILAMIVLVIAQFVIALVLCIFGLIPILGIIVELIFLAPISIFEARYICQLYDAAGTA
ncbi:DUF4013 domain-containing protein [Methanoregula sp.]|jgi:hypothetical protein|uniref:DUF4013 domain-containing protein n=1 Tax=Methanoregula sp. TaxID=2052170 RepID=UPI003C252DA1